MATVLEIATQAGVSPEQVLRVVNGEPVSGEVEERVRAAMEALGRPAYPKPSPREPARLPASGAEARDDALERLAGLAAELEETLPAQMGSVVVEALRVEVRPVAEHVAGLQSLFEGLVAELRRLRREIEAERRDRVEDLALQVELLRASWVGVDRRLGRIERDLARREERAPAPSALSRIDGLRSAEVLPVQGANGGAPADNGSPE